MLLLHTISSLILAVKTSWKDSQNKISKTFIIIPTYLFMLNFYYYKDPAVFALEENSKACTLTQIFKTPQLSERSAEQCSNSENKWSIAHILYIHH